MVDIYGRSLTDRKRVKPVKTISRKDVTDITSSMLSSLLTLTDADSDEVVVFDSDKKLKTSNISANDILEITKYKDELVDFFVPKRTKELIAKEKPEAKVQLIHVKAANSNLAELQRDYDNHVNNFIKFRNTLNGFFTEKAINEFTRKKILFLLN